MWIDRNPPPPKTPELALIPVMQHTHHKIVKLSPRRTRDWTRPHDIPEETEYPKVCLFEHLKLACLLFGLFCVLHSYWLSHWIFVFCR